ncbi:MAG TPA: TonB-dependent receptor [Bryobacteraceae bacterium]|nr:TonB-dependent receptor [Bryobacteraceae bacterium]
MKHPRRVLPLLLFCVAGAAPVRAQPFSYVSGVILDPSRAAVPEAQVTVLNEDSGFRREVRSQPDGGYVVASLDPGVYKITVRKEGFRTMIRFGVKLELGRPAEADFLLSIGSVRETITVEGTAPGSNSQDAAVSTVIGRDRIERLPLSGHNLLALMDLAPGTLVTPATRGEAGQFTASGQRPNSNYFTIDGLSANTGVSAGGLPAQATGGTLPGMSALGSLHSLIPLEALDEFRIETATARPEFGKLPGAQVALVSRSGSNNLHGSLVYAFRHEDMAANDWFANQNGEGRAALRLNDFAASLGGPIRRDRTFFFLSYEGIRLRQPFAWETAVPSAEARAEAPAAMQPALNFFPVANGGDLGNGLAAWIGRNNRPSRLDVGSLRLDHAISSRLTLFARYNDSPSFNEFGATEISQLNLRAKSLTAGLNLRAPSDLVVDLRTNGSVSAVHTFWKTMDDTAAGCSLEPTTLYLVRVPGLCDRLLRFSISGVGEIISGREGDRQQTQWNVTGTASRNRGAHSLRAGFDYRRLAPDRHDATGTLSVIADNLDDFVSNHNLWIASSPPEYDSVVVRELSLFAQDTWRIASRFTLTYGLRWEYSPPPAYNLPSYSLDPVQGTVVRTSGPIWPQRFSNFAPRLGLAFQPSHSNRTVVRIGGGLYYDSSLSIATDVINGGPLGVRQFGNDRYAPFSMLLSYGFVPNLRMPVVAQYSASVEHAFGDHDAVTVGYVGSQGRRLIRREMGGPGSSAVSWVALATNHGASGYNGLEMQYRRRLARRLQGLVAYTWSHSLDNSSTDTAFYWAGPAVSLGQDRASSDFDARHAFTAAFTWELPPLGSAGRGAAWLRGWALDGILHTRTGFPITVLNSDQAMGIAFANAARPDLVGGQPVWIADGAAPGGRRLNRAAFETTPGLTQGSLGRNALSGFGMSQLDLALRRDFTLRAERRLEFRLEAFNALNHPNFADPVRYLASPLFGSAPSMLNLMLGTGSPASGLAPLFQTGGARSLEAALRFTF